MPKHLYLPNRLLAGWVINPFICGQSFNECILDDGDQVVDILLCPRGKNIVGEEAGKWHGGQLFNHGNADEVALNPTSPQKTLGEPVEHAEKVVP